MLGRVGLFLSFFLFTLAIAGTVEPCPGDYEGVYKGRYQYRLTDDDDLYVYPLKTRNSECILIALQGYSSSNSFVRIRYFINMETNETSDYEQVLRNRKQMYRATFLDNGTISLDYDKPSVGLGGYSMYKTDQSYRMDTLEREFMFLDTLWMIQIHFARIRSKSYATFSGDAIYNAL